MVDLTHRSFRLVATRMCDGGIRMSAGPDAIPVQLVIDPAVWEHLDARTPAAGLPEPPAVRERAGRGRVATERLGASHGAA
jgi:hypothetical protein